MPSSPSTVYVPSRVAVTPTLIFSCAKAVPDINRLASVARHKLPFNMNSSHSRFVDVLLRADCGALNAIDPVPPFRGNQIVRIARPRRMHGDLTASLILFAAAQREKSLPQHFQRIAPAGEQTIRWQISPGKGFTCA